MPSYRALVVAKIRSVPRSDPYVSRSLPTTSWPRTRPQTLNGHTMNLKAHHAVPTSLPAENIAGGLISGRMTTISHSYELATRN